jgi:hypothetical protein
MEVLMHCRSHELLSIAIPLLDQKAIDELRVIQRWVDRDPGVGERSPGGQPLSVLLNRGKTAVIPDYFDRVLELEMASHSRVMIEHEPE